MPGRKKNGIDKFVQPETYSNILQNSIRLLNHNLHFIFAVITLSLKLIYLLTFGICQWFSATLNNFHSIFHFLLFEKICLDL